MAILTQILLSALMIFAGLMMPAVMAGWKQVSPFILKGEKGWRKPFTSRLADAIRWAFN